MPSGFAQRRARWLSGVTPPVRLRTSSSPGSPGTLRLAVPPTGHQYYAARNNEFGFANYEIIPAPQIAANP